MTAILTLGDAANLHLPNETVNLIVTSPPYFGLRSYTDGGEHYRGQIGAEATPTEYLDALIACTAEWMRVLKPGGSIFVNLGDRYSSSRRTQERSQVARDTVEGVRSKSLVGLPWRYAIRCIDDLGLILRAEIIWSKSNGLPESVTDRVRRSHEQVFHFVKQPRYYAAVDEIRESYSPNKPWGDGSKSGRKIGAATAHVRGHDESWHQQGLGNGQSRDENPLGKLPGSVWEIPTAPLIVPAHLGVDHFAAYPPELVRRIVLGWSPREVCTACGEGRRPVAVTERSSGGAYRPPAAPGRIIGGRHGQAGSTLGPRGVVATITGYACACPGTTAASSPGVVLDPFAGTGTTMLVASVLGRVGIGVDMSADYVRLAQWRVNDPGERARALQVDKPPVQIEGQMGLFEAATGNATA